MHSCRQDMCFCCRLSKLLRVLAPLLLRQGQVAASPANTNGFQYRLRISVLVTEFPRCNTTLPVESLWPCCCNAFAKALEFFTTWAWYAWNSGVLANFSATAIPTNNHNNRSEKSTLGTDDSLILTSLVLASYGVIMWSALQAWKNGLVDGLFVIVHDLLLCLLIYRFHTCTQEIAQQRFLSTVVQIHNISVLVTSNHTFTVEYYTRSRTSKSLMRSGGYNVTVLERARMHFSRD